MDFKKVLDQTVRDLKREVNKKVLKVPEIEQKVLDATSNEPWGPHGTAMAEIAQATRNYYEHQMIVTIIWKRLSDTGRNWRHVYKALTLLEYLVAHGSERVVDDIKEHSYQISALMDFQYLDSTGRDQGINVRKKSQTLMSLVNDKEKIKEARQKAVENRDKYRGVSSTGGFSKTSTYGDRYEDDGYGGGSRYGGRDDNKHRDSDRYRDEDRGRESDNDRYGREGDRYRDYNNEDDRYNARRGDDRQSEKYKGYEKELDRPYDDDDRHSSRGGGGRDDEYRRDDWRADHKMSPPSYEEAQRSPEYQVTKDERNKGTLAGQVLNSNVAQVEDPVSTTKSFFDDDDEFNPRAPTGARGS